MRRNSERSAAGTRRREAPWPPSKQRLQGLVEEAVVDADGESEQRTGSSSMIDEHLALLFETKVLGVAVAVERIDIMARLKIAAYCRRGHETSVDPDPPPPPVAQAATRRRGADRGVSLLGARRMDKAGQSYFSNFRKSFSNRNK